MPPRVLNEENIQAREQEIIDIAIRLTQDIGVEHLTMDKVVAEAPYSKGTIYKHFLGKEDLLLAIGNRAIGILLNLFSRASNTAGSTRNRMLLVNFSYLLYAMLHPVLFQTAICSKSPNVYGKSSDKRREEQEQLEAKLLGILYGIIEQAIAEKQLSLPKHISIQQICFSNWSAAYGTISLLSGDPDENCGGRYRLVVEQELYNQSSLLLDGLHWLPLEKDHDHSKALKKALTTTFSTELQLLENTGYTLNF